MIRFFSDGINFQLGNKRIISKWLRQVAAEEGKKTGDLCFIFVADEKILDINKKFLQHNYFTDIITFDNSEGNLINGEMYISIDTVRSNAQDYGVVFSHELMRVMLHGILHLCGHDDKTEEQEKTMRTLEDKYLTLVIMHFNNH